MIFYQSAMLLQTFNILGIELEEDTNQIYVTLYYCIAFYKKIALWIIRLGNIKMRVEQLQTIRKMIKMAHLLRKKWSIKKSTT